MEQKTVQYLIILSSLTFFVVVLIIISLVNYFLKKRAQYLLDKERSEAEFETNLSIAKEEIVEQNLKNISWELHDNVGQLLSVASIEVNVLKEKAMDFRPELDDISQLISKSLSEIRSLSKTLNAELSLGLKASINLELDRLNRLQLVSCNLNYNDDVDLNVNQEIIIFRMLQEFITNTLKHADANTISIRVDSADQQIHISAVDDGKGFDEKEVVASNGLNHMQRRAELIGADYKLYSVVGKGTHLNIIIPMDVVNG